MGNLTISMAIFNSYVNVYQRVICGDVSQQQARKIELELKLPSGNLT